MSDWDVVKLLRHARHDWLNKIQLIKGNISLNHINRANEIIDELIIEARHEAKLSNLSFPRLAEFLLTFNWNQHMFRLETEVIGEEVNLNSYDQPLLHFTSEFFQLIDDWVSSSDEHHILVTFQLYDEHTRVSFDFSGHINNIESVKDWLNDFQLHKSLTKIESYINKEEIFITLQLD
jgi:stage 0 sporulation protein B (sporulation initiation phosphotransferase)